MISNLASERVEINKNLAWPRGVDSLAVSHLRATPINLSANALSNLPVSFPIVSGPAAILGSILTITGAGDVVVRAAQAGTTTYASAMPVDESFTVKPALLLIVANPMTSIAGQAIPTLSASYVGFVNGDTAATLTSQPILATAATATSPAGLYAITIHGASSPNYNVTQLPGLLTLTAPEPPTTVISGSFRSIRITKHKSARAIILDWNAPLNLDDALSRANYRLTKVPTKKKHSQAVVIRQILYLPVLPRWESLPKGL